MGSKLAWACLLLLPLNGWADAIMRSAAMFADTIAEYYVEDDHVRLELEVGESDIASFRNLLPDSIYRELGFGDTPLADRLPLFTGRDLAIVRDGEPLPGLVQSIGPTTRPLRDDVTGEELPTPDEQAVLVVGVTLIYPFDGHPESLTLMAPRETGLASIGFVLYHKGVAVNDYRYLSSGYTVQLDWDDPWYSAFPQRALKRQYESPMTGFIYVEPFEVRKEIIVRPHDIQQWVDLGLEGREVITAGAQAEIKRKIVEFLAPHFKVKIDGRPVEGSLDRVNFLRRTLRSSTVIDNQTIPLLPATLGVIYVYPTEGLPQTVEMEWDLFTDKMQRIPSASVDQAGALPTILEPDFNVLKWVNFLKQPQIPTLVDVRAPPTAIQNLTSWGRWAALGTAGLLAVILLRARSRRGRFPAPFLVGLLLCLLATALMEREYRKIRMDPEQTRQLTSDLLHNVYRAFDFRGEETIYDVLAGSVAGDLLTDLYLETRRGLELANQGGARVKVKSIEVLASDLVSSGDGSMKLESKWNVSGSVGHWGHVHQRKNGYHALLDISVVDGAWKLTGLEILQEARL